MSTQGRPRQQRRKPRASTDTAGNRKRGLCAPFADRAEKRRALKEAGPRLYNWMRSTRQLRQYQWRPAERLEQRQPRPAGVIINHTRMCMYHHQSVAILTCACHEPILSVMTTVCKSSLGPPRG